MHLIRLLEQHNFYWGARGTTVGPAAPVGATSTAAAEVAAGVASTTGFLTSVVDSGDFFFSA
jgi:hypothetical protein